MDLKKIIALNSILPENYTYLLETKIIDMIKSIIQNMETLPENDPNFKYKLLIRIKSLEETQELKNKLRSFYQKEYLDD